MGLTDTSLLCKLALGIAVLAVVFDVVSLSTNGWLTHTKGSEKSDYGLWNICLNGQCESTPSHLVDSALEAVRAMVLMGFIAGSGCIGAIILYIFKAHIKLVRLIVLICSIVAAVCTLIGFAVYVAIIKGDDENVLAYSFYLSILSFLLYLGVSICVILDICKNQV